MECPVFSEKGAFLKWNASFSQKKGLFRSGMLCFFRKRGFSEVECFVFSEKEAFPGWNASFSQKMSFPGVECFVFSEKGSCSCEASFSQKKEGGFARDPREGYTLRGRLHDAASASLLCDIFAQ